MLIKGSSFDWLRNRSSRVQGLLFATLAVFPFLMCACSEQGAENEYDDWEQKNVTYIDSIAKVAQANADGSWTIYKAYTLGDSTQLYNGQNSRFIYVQKLKSGSGTASPLYTESVRVHYTGHLIPSKTYTQGYNFDKSFAGEELNTDTDVPSLLSVSSTVVGFATALQYMKVGDRWKVYIPYQLGYGTTTTTKIPAYSTLIFDMTLARIYASDADDTEWY